MERACIEPAWRSRNGSCGKQDHTRLYSIIALLISEYISKHGIAGDLARRDLTDIQVKIFTGQKEVTPLLEKDGSFAIPLDWCEIEDLRINVSVDGSPAETLTRNDIRQQLLRAQAAEAKLKGAKKNWQLHQSELLSEVAPVITAEVPVAEMQPEPQHN